MPDFFSARFEMKYFFPKNNLLPMTKVQKQILQQISFLAWGDGWRVRERKKVRQRVNERERERETGDAECSMKRMPKNHFNFCGEHSNIYVKQLCPLLNCEGGWNSLNS
jgi:hypothetical protein